MEFKLQLAAIHFRADQGDKLKLHALPHFRAVDFGRKRNWEDDDKVKKFDWSISGAFR
ncbi:MAG: hypothetical protein ACREA2_20625 [Blastocatellia bacterium]